MKSKFYSHLLLLFILLTTTNAKWTRIIYDPANVHLNSMDIYSENMMVMVGDAGLVRVSTDTEMKNILNFFIPDHVALLSVACLDNSSIIVGAENGNLYRTSNLGIDWKITVIETGTPITNLKFINSQIGLLSLNNGSIKRTGDGGDTWEEVYAPDEKPINDIFYKSGGDIWIAGKGKLLISKDMGLTWENRLSSIPGSNGMTNMYRISAPSRDTIFTLSDFLNFYYSYDAGKSWQNITIDQSAMYKFTDPRFAGFEFFNGSLGIIRVNDISLSLLYYEFITTDGGKSFKTIRYNFGDDNIGVSMRGIEFLDENTGYSYGGNGEIMKISIVTDSIPHFRYDSMSDVFVPYFSHVASNSGNRVALISDNGIYKYLWLSTNGGFDWKKSQLDAYQFDNETSSVIGISYPSTSNLLLTLQVSWSKIVNGTSTYISKGYLARSTDGGMSFSLYTIPDTFAMTPIEMLDENHGCFTYSKNESSNIKYTSNGGSSWEDLKPPSPGLYAYKVTSPEPGVFFAYYRSGTTGKYKFTLHRTYDNGNTWSAGDTLWGYYTIKIKFRDKMNGYLISRMTYNKIDSVYHYYIFKTSDAGNTWQIKYTDTSDYYGYSFRDLEFNGNTVIATRNISPVYISTDDGENWKSEYPTQFEPNGRISSATIPSPKECIAVTYLGHIFVNDELIAGKEEIFNKQADDLTISPNPANIYIEINIGNTLVYSLQQDIKIYNAIGECVIVVQTPPSVQRIDISQLPPGVYFLCLNNGKETLTSSFIILR